MPNYGRPRRASKRLTPLEVALVKKLLLLGELQHDIAARFGVNQGRISEINTGRKWGHIPPAL